MLDNICTFFFIYECYSKSNNLFHFVCYPPPQDLAVQKRRRRVRQQLYMKRKFEVANNNGSKDLRVETLFVGTYTVLHF
jgi:hypothetical protein